MQIFKSHSGRSMVEMLGVLAIIGVLSIGGIMGYSYGMDKYRANQTMQDVNLRGIDVLAQFDRIGDANLNEWQNEKTIYPITLEDETIGIQVDEVPERVCNMLAEGMVHVATGIKVNGAYVTGDNNTCDGDENTLVFYFDEESVANVPVLEQCGDVVCEQCEVCDQNTMTCVSVIEKMNGLSNIDDLRICTSNGYQSYCGLTEEGCAELGTCEGDPECNVRVEGACQPLDSAEILAVGLGAFRCTKDGKDGYCFAGECAVSEDPSDCGEHPECFEKFGGQCMPLTSTCGFSIQHCSANGMAGICVSGTCLTGETVLALCQCASNKDCGSGQFCKKTMFPYPSPLSTSKHYISSCETPSCTEYTKTYVNEEGKTLTETIYKCDRVEHNNQNLCTAIGKSIVPESMLFSYVPPYYTPEAEAIPTERGKAFADVFSDICKVGGSREIWFSEATQKFYMSEDNWDTSGHQLCW